jgi:hypothetical protein
MFYRCKKVQHKPINIQVRDPIQWSKRNQVCCGLAHRTVSSAPGPYRVEPATLGFQQAHSAIIHRTVRCASGATANSRNDRLCKGEQCSYSAMQKSEQKVRRGIGLSGVASDCPVWHRTVRCGKKTRLQWSTELRTLTVG